MISAKVKRIGKTVFAVLGIVLLAGIVIRNKGNLSGVSSDLQQLIGFKL